MDPELRFDILKYARGSHYSALMATKIGVGLDGVIDQRRASPDWQDRVTAAILMGRIVDPQLFAQINAEMDAETPARATRRVTGLDGLAEKYELLAVEHFGPRSLPVALEGATRHARDAEDWRVAAYVRMVGAIGDPIGVEPLMDLMFSTSSPAVAGAVATALRNLPGDAVAPHLDAADARAGMVSRALQQAREG